MEREEVDRPKKTAQTQEKQLKEKQPHLVIKRDRVLKNCDVISITNKRLSIQCFERKGQGFKYYYRFNLGQAHGAIALKVLGDDFAKAFDTSRGRFAAAKGEIEPAREGGYVPSAIEINGGKGLYSVAFIIQNAKLPFCFEGTVGMLEFKVQCYGSIRQTRHIKSGTKEIDYEGIKTPEKLPKTVVWAAKHPYCGGSVSPK